MGNLTSPKFPDDDIPGSRNLHPEGILGGLPEPTTSNSLDLLVNRHPPDIDRMPYTVTNGQNPTMAVTTFSRINDPGAVAPSDEVLGFDPYGLKDVLTFVLHPLDALKAYELGKQARTLTTSLYPADPDGRHNNAPDAFRHAYWNYTMAQAFGPAEARSFGNAREIWEPNPVGERYMDLYNNQIGRDLAANGQGSPIDSIKNAVARGYTRNTPFK